MAIAKSNFQGIALTVPLDGSEQVDSIKVELVAEDVSIEKALYVTDVMLQGGGVPTENYPHPSEMRWSNTDV